MGNTGGQRIERGERFNPGVVEHLGFYVYLLVDPRDRSVFYVGKGLGDRCFEHIKVARTDQRDHTREFAKLDVIRAIEEAGQQVRIEILRHGLDEPLAFEVESAAIDLLGMTTLTNAVAGTNTRLRGRMTIAEVNALHGAEPVIIRPAHRVILIRVSRAYRRGIDDEELYEITRGFWKFSKRWSDPTDAASPQYAFSVYAGVVRAVYRIDHWYQPVGIELEADATREGRWGFRGERDLGMEDLYAGRDVTSYMTQGAQNPITYANCASKRVRP